MILTALLQKFNPSKTKCWKLKEWTRKMKKWNQKTKEWKMTAE